MGRIIKSILMTIAIACAGVSIFFIITIIGNRDVVVDAYNNLSDSKERGADVVRNNFLQVYGTYGEELFIALGINKTDFAPGGVGDSDPGTPGEEIYKVCTCTDKCTSDTDFDDTCEVCKVDWKQCAYIPPCTCLGNVTQPCDSTNVYASCEACNLDIKYCLEKYKGGTGGPPSGNTHTINGPDGLGYIEQSNPDWALIGNPNGGLSVKSAGCGILAAYAAYANNGGTESFEETILGCFPDRVETNAQGKLQNKSGKGFSMGLGTPDWNSYCGYLGLSVSGPTSGIPNAEGDYIFRYLYSGGGQHNIFVRVEKDGSGNLVYRAACSSGLGWDNTINRSGFSPQYYYKVN